MIGDLVKTEFNRHKLRTFLTVSGIVIGIFLLSTIASFSTGLNASIQNDLNYLSGLVTVVDGDVTFMNYEASEIDEIYVSELATISGVEKSAPVIFVGVAGVGTILGFNSNDLDLWSSESVGYEKGRLFEEDAYEITLGYQVSKDLDYVVGDFIEIRGQEFEIVGIFKETGTSDDDSIMMSIDMAQNVWGRDDKISIIMLKPYNIDDVDFIVEIIEKDYNDDLRAFSQKDIQKTAQQFLTQLNIMIYSIGAIAAIVAGIVIMNAMFMSVRERTRQIGTMKAVGATDMQILLEILAEAVIISLIGGSIGLLMAFGASVGINSYLGTNLTRINVPLVLGSLLFSLTLGVLGGLLPAKKAAGISPIEALRYE